MTYAYHGYPEEHAAFTPPEKISFADFTEKYITLDRSIASEHGAKRISRTPVLRPLYDALGNPDVREVDCRKSAQLAVTSVAFDLIAFFIVQRPRPICYFLADQQTAEKVGERLRTTLRLCKPVADLIVEERFNKSEMVFRNGASVTLAWGSSIAATGSTPYGLIIIDEADKPGYGVVGKEGATFGRIRERCVTFDDYLIFVFSTPTTEDGNISVELGKCPVVVEPRVPCVKCGALQPLKWSPQKFTDSDGVEKASGFVYFDNEAATVSEKAASARYQCYACGYRMTTAEKNDAVSRVVPQHFEIAPRMGFDGLSRLYSLFRGGRLEDMTQTFLDSKDDPLELQTFVNSVLGEVWKRHKVTRTEDELRAAETDLPAGIVPDAADCLIATIDMQQHGFWYVVRAWQASIRQSWLVEFGQIGTWEDVSELVFERTWLRQSGGELGIWRAGLDTGGTKEDGQLISRTEEAYSWWINEYHLARGRVFLCKGSSRAMSNKLDIGKIMETTPSGKKINRYCLQIVTLNTPVLKRLFLHGIGQAIQHQQQAAHLFANTPRHYYQQITAEAEDENGDFVRLRPDNHALDCEATQYALISRELHGGIDQLSRNMRATAQTVKKNLVQNSTGEPAPNPFTGGSFGGGNPYTGR